jgi:hypothetical protein
LNQPKASDSPNAPLLKKENNNHAKQEKNCENETGPTRTHGGRQKGFEGDSEGSGTGTHESQKI